MSVAHLLSQDAGRIGLQQLCHYIQGTL